ncbi:MAG: TetR/AcrR family transcriptional regulator [Planctomycetota bacterium]
MQGEERRQKKAEMKREAILRSAAAAFRRKGFHGTSMEEISEALLMTKGSLYYYFKDKEDILYACHDFSLKRLEQHMAEIKAAEFEGDGQAAQRLALMIQGLVDVMIDDLQGSALALDFGVLSAEQRAGIIDRRDEFEHAMRHCVQQGIDSNEFRNVDAKMTTFAILGAINWINQWYHPDGDLRARDIGKVYADLFVEGLKAGALPVIK